MSKCFSSKDSLKPTAVSFTVMQLIWNIWRPCAAVNHLGRAPRSKPDRPACRSWSAVAARRMLPTFKDRSSQSKPNTAQNIHIHFLNRPWMVCGLPRFWFVENIFHFLLPPSKTYCVITTCGACSQTTAQQQALSFASLGEPAEGHYFHW